MIRAELFEKLNKPSRLALENAMRSAKIRGNPYVELSHWIEQMTLTEHSDIQKIAEHFDLNFAKLTADLTAYIDFLQRGASSISDISEHVFDAVERGFAIGALQFKEANVRSGHILYAALDTGRLRSLLLPMSDEFRKISTEDLQRGFAGIVAGSVEDNSAPGAGAGYPGESSGAMSKGSAEASALARYTTDMTQLAASGEMDPIVGRDDEIRHMVDILMRRRQNNPILTGEAGVGKTAVVEGFAQRIARGDVPPSLHDISLLSLDIGLLQAGASMKGEFEDRLRQVIDEVQSSEKPVVLFIDEAHTLIGAGGAAGTGDAANLLKPALARGELRTIAATTWAEYKKYIEKDPALTRRFEVVKVDEPTEEKALLMLRGVAGPLESHHNCLILDDALEAAVRYSGRYVPARQLPDKAVALLDTACARVAVSQHAVPAEVDNIRRHIAALEVEKRIAVDEQNFGIGDEARVASINAGLEDHREKLERIEERWSQEDELVQKVLALRSLLKSGSGLEKPAEDDTEDMTTANQSQLRIELAEACSALSKLQGEQPLVLPTVDRQVIAKVVEGWTGIPVSRMGAGDVDSLLGLADRLSQTVVGQDHAMQIISKSVQTSRAGLTAREKPVGVFLLAGPSGTGKTETAITLAKELYGGEQNLITINMSEFQEAHTVSTLKGAPPGYVGYGEGGVLTEAVRRRPYSVVLLDEVEKAHSDVHEIFFQVFDKGVMEDGEGRTIDFKNCLILLTSNVGSDLIMSLCEDPDLAPDADALAKALRPPLLEVFPAALLGRLITVPFFPLSEEMIHAITALKLKSIKRRVRDTHGAELEYGSDVLELVAARCSELESGGRMIDAILTNTMLPAISREILARMRDQAKISKIAVYVVDGEFSYVID